jgi:hypothetical protein
MWWTANFLKGPDMKSLQKVILSLAFSLAVVLIAPQAAFAASIPNPEGVLLARGDLAIIGNPISEGQYFSNAQVIGTDSFDFFGTNYYYRALNSDPDCRLQWEHGEGGTGEGNLADNLELHPYTTDVITILETGIYTFRVVASAGIADPFMALYDSNGFDPNTPDSNLIGCNEDSDYEDGDVFSDNGVDTYPYPSYDGYWSEFSVEIGSTGNYTLVMATYDFYQNDADWYSGVAAPGYVGATINYTSDANGDSGVGSASTATFEYWGPTGGINGPIECEGCSSSGTSQTNPGAVSSASSPGIMLDFQGAAGNPVAGSQIHIGGTGILASSPYTLTLRSPQRVLDSGNTNAGGEFWNAVGLPAGLAPGTYTLSLTALGADGSPLAVTKTFIVSAAGTLTYMGDSAAASQLARTGGNPTLSGGLLSASGLLTLTGIATLVAVRRRVASAEA